jgi:hypothetical protein
MSRFGQDPIPGMPQETGKSDRSSAPQPDALSADSDALPPPLFETSAVLAPQPTVEAPPQAQRSERPLGGVPARYSG